MRTTKTPPAPSAHTLPERRTRPRPLLLVVENDPVLREQIDGALSGPYETLFSENRAEAVALFRARRPPLVVLDLGLTSASHGPMEGLLALAEMTQIDPNAKIVVVSGQAQHEHALKSVENGACDFFIKPFDPDEVRLTLERAFHLFRLEKENREMQADGWSADEPFGASPPMKAIAAMARKAAATDLPVLITGESGTGKEWVAQAIHRQSARNAGPFVAIHCGAIPENLLESELFGHEKGAFTGAHLQRKGRIEAAEGGTLFLDEIGEMTPALQVKMLRFLQEKTIERVGGRATISINARVIAATHRDLPAEVREGRFREDLFYRLHVVAILLPPLSERAEDLLTLARLILSREAAHAGKRRPDFSPEAVEAMTAYRWPGNVRELENKIKRGVAMSESRLLSPADMDFEYPAQPRPDRLTLKDALEALDRRLIQSALDACGGNITHAASRLGITRQTLYTTARRSGIDVVYSSADTSPNSSISDDVVQSNLSDAPASEV